MAVGLPDGPSYPGLSAGTTIFSPCCPLNDCRRAAHSFFKIGRLSCLLSPVLSGYNGSPDTRFSRGTTRLMDWPDGEQYSRPHARTPHISFCTVQLRTLCAARSLATLYLFTTFGPGPGELPSFWGFMVFRHASIPRKGSGNNNNNSYYISTV